MMIVLMLTKLNRLGEAYREAIATIAEAEAAVKVNRKYATALAAARAKVKDFETQVAFINVVVAPQVIRSNSVLSVAGRSIPRDRWGVPHAVTPGRVTVALSGHPARTLNVVAGRQYPVRFMTAASGDGQQSGPADGGTTPDGSKPRNLLLPGAVVAGAGGVSLILAGIFGGMAQGTFNDLEAQCPGGQCPPEAQADIDSGIGFQTASNVTLVMGLVALAAGSGLIAFHLFGPKAGAKSADSAGTKASGASAKVVFGVASGGVQVRF